jgi:hypothetical protein
MNYRQERLRVAVPFALLLFVLSFGQAQSLIIPQIADGGGWQTTIVVTNTTASATSASLSFSQDVGGGATQNWNLPFLEGGSTQNLNLPAGGTMFLHTPGTAAATTSGWAQVQAPAAVVAYAIFTLRVPGRQNQDGTAAASQGVSRILMPYDNTSNFVTSMAIVNTTSASESVSVGIQPSSGASSQPTAINLPAQGHMAFAVPQQFSTTGGQSGLLEFYGASGSFSILALRFNPTGAFTTAQVYLETGPPIVAAGASTNVSGLWGDGSFILALNQTGQAVSGTFRNTSKNGALSSGNISGSVQGTTFNFSTDHYYDNTGCGSQITGASAQITGITMAGSLTVTDDMSAACGAGQPPVHMGTFSLKQSVEEYCGTYNNPGHDAGIFTALVSSDGSFVGSSTVTNGYVTRMPVVAFAGQVVGNTFTQTSVNQDGSPGLIGSILNGVLSGTFGTGDPSGAVGTFTASTSACQ